ncbi:MAG: hypothetical protein Q8O40_05440 [Chloroflexota bacterium]|nr:hypothetical protein [Chloroflexota bacterium]
MKKLNGLHRIAIGLGVAVVVGILVAVMAIPAGAASGGVSASGENQANITITLIDSTAGFGTNLDPSGTASNSSDTVVARAGSTGNQGAYYEWKANGGDGLTIEVKSNKTWNGTMAASENSGTSSSMTVASGALRYAEGSEPTSYSACSSGTAFQSTAQTWKSNVAKGKSSYTQYYCLRVDWTDDPGTFVSNTTYTVTQAD